MENTRVINIVDANGNIENVEVVTYLSSDDGEKKYVVYSKNENYGDNPDDRIIYISRLNIIDDVLSLSEIVDDSEWNDVQKLLRRIANATN